MRYVPYGSTERYSVYSEAQPNEDQVTRKGMLINAREIPLDEDWVYFEAIKPNNKSSVHSYLRHKCYPQKLSGVNSHLAITSCNNCEEEASKEIIDKATVLMKMRIL